MKDLQGREIDYVRISLTSRCNLQCCYCVPQNACLSAQQNELSGDEIERICTILSGIGIKKVKLTGGEPLLRNDIAQIVSNIKKINGIQTVTLTTNGILLDRYTDELIDAGIDCINISLDTVREDRFREITHVGGVETVLRTIDAICRDARTDCKVNCVPMYDDDDLINIAELARDRNVKVRFIEMMPLGEGKNYHSLDTDTVKSRLSDAFGILTPCKEKFGNGPAEYVRIGGFQGTIGFIGAVSHRFCDSCNRVRITSDGYMKNCLQYEADLNLKELLHEGKTDREIGSILYETIRRKPAGHHFMQGVWESDESARMVAIGG